MQEKRAVLISLWLIIFNVALSLQFQGTPDRILINRRTVVGTIYASFPAFVPAAVAFDGGVGGLGKTKPETGVVLREGSQPVQNKEGIVTAEIVSSKGNLILVEFKTPYPLLSSTTGLEARDLQKPDSAFVQVIDGVSSNEAKKVITRALSENILGSKGKFGAYAIPTDIKFRDTEVPNLFKVTFTAYTPAMRESERTMLVQCKWVDEGQTLVALVTGTTMVRFKSEEKTLTKIAESFVAIDAPRTQLTVKK
mmetsp:Transcript_30509/g.46212  ORF Transcript_30509/g.46212 Transcript_30509/m.46212 type:complete len:252 (+) Transcript_30509:240-995(+)|eukprot:CAMPEP_0178922920 /NCGR_PEP_ID=MMETSP0786-20121207/16428_1 /TAXON_ID=186022 /ORGANISM="Thalassionema frauenfeldii, Strain CCMP 1798" /LENGTH=251 /DNA_ID=CAMNT_0020597351 /DNA_START=134 /DNA_END=889 /DNA_ORIENTATION=-